MIRRIVGRLADVARDANPVAYILGGMATVAVTLVAIFFGQAMAFYVHLWHNTLGIIEWFVAKAM